MPLIAAKTSRLVLIDFQERLMPAIDDAETVLRNARRLLNGARLLDIPAVATEQNPSKLGPTVPMLAAGRTLDTIGKMSFDAGPADSLSERLPPESDIVIAGCEAHVCVLQTALGLLAAGRRVFVVADAIGSRRPESKAIAIRRMEANGAEVVTSEMVLFEWLGSAEHPRFREVVALIK